MSFWLSARLALSRPDTFVVATIMAAFATAGVLAGYVIASGKPTAIALTLGAIAGVALLNALPLVVWIILAGVLLLSGPVVMFVPELDKATWLFSLLGFFLTGAAILYSAVGRERFNRPLPAFVVMAALFFVFGFLSLLYSGGPLAEGVRAGKRYFQFFGLLFILAAVPFPPALVKRWWGFLVALGAIQLPFALYQRIFLVPIREGMPGVVPIDIVVGTMEGSIVGGGSSSVMAMFLVCILAFLLSAYRDGILPTRRFLLLALVVSTPLALGAVTVVIILLPLALFVVYLDLIRRRPIRFLMGVALLLPILAFSTLAYVALNLQPGETVATVVESVIEYNFGDVGYYGGYSLNRTSVYVHWLEQQRMSDPVSFFFGHGLGSSFGGVNEPNPGHMDQAHPWMFIGLTAASSVLWDLGIVGLLLFIGLHVSAARCAFKLAAQANPGFDRAFCRTLSAMALMLLAMVLFSSGPILLPSHEVLMAVSLGLIAWRWRSLDRSRTSAVG